MTKAPSTSHDDAVAQELRKDPVLAADYLKAAIAQNDEPRVLLVALRHLAAAHGMPEVARRAKIEREMSYDAELRREVALLREALLRLGRGVAATN
jgi:DNA-binding phage protein